MDGFRCGGWVGLGEWMCNTGNGYVEMRGECELQGGEGGGEKTLKTRISLVTSFRSGKPLLQNRQNQYRYDKETTPSQPLAQESREEPTGQPNQTGEIVIWAFQTWH